MSYVAADFLLCSVATEIPCCDKLLKAFGRNREFSVATKNPGTWDFRCCDIRLMSRQCTAEAHGDRAP